MRPLLLLSFAGLTLLPPSAEAGKRPQEPSRQLEIVPGVVYVKYRGISGASKLRTLRTSSLERYQARLRSLPFGEAGSEADAYFARWVTYTVSSVYDMTAVLAELRKDPFIEYAEPSYVHRTSQDPNDSLTTQMWHLQKILASQAWDMTTGDTNVVIGICDSGVDDTHPDLAANRYVRPGESGVDGLGLDRRTNGVDDDANGYIDDWRGWDFVGARSETIRPDNGPHPSGGSPHGTHVAGIAAAVTNNAVGIPSIGYRCKWLATKHSADVEWGAGIFFGYEGILYLVNNGAQVINCSWGAYGERSQFAQDVLLYALRHNVVVVAAAGNDGMDLASVPHFPASLRGAFSVGSTDQDDLRAYFSNYGAPADIHVFAPGVSILSTVPNGEYSSGFSGTSMSAALVSGLAGLVRSKYPAYSAGQVMLQIAGTCDPLDPMNPSYGGLLGFGRINAYRAVTETPAPASPIVDLISVVVSDSLGGNNNGILEPGERASVMARFENNWGDAVNGSVTLSVDPGFLSIASPSPGGAVRTIGLMPGITNLDSSSWTNDSDPFGIAIAQDAIPCTIPYTLTFAADGGYVRQFHREFRVMPSVLFVDDDDGNVNVERYFHESLRKLNVVHDTWDHASQGTPSAEALRRYSAVIWTCEWTFPSLDSLDRVELRKYLDGGGNLFISGQDVGWDLSDPSSGDQPNEFAKSGGESKDFYERYLRAVYRADDAFSGGIRGVAGDPIGDRMVFQRYQPGRAPWQQWGDVIDTINGSLPVFVVAGGPYDSSVAAVRYEGAYRLVNFGFGGFEAIVDSVSRYTVMARVVDQLVGGYEHTPVRDNENYTTPYPVELTAHATEITSVELGWNTTGLFPFTRVAMTPSEGARYVGSIPAQPLNTDVWYFLLIRSGDRYLPYRLRSFHVSADLDPPMIVVADTILNSIRLQGPYELDVRVTDLHGIDSTTLLLTWAVNGGPDNQTNIMGIGTPDGYRGSILPSQPLQPGDQITYALTVSDRSRARNEAQYPAAGRRVFTVGRETLDDFERADLTSSRWSVGGWGTDLLVHHSGSHAMADSPEGLYPRQTDNALTLRRAVDLSGQSQAVLRYYRRVFIDPTDTLYVEAGADTVHWSVLFKHTGFDPVFGGMIRQDLRLEALLAAGADSVWVRFRLSSDATLEQDGAYIDDVEILIGSLTDVEDATSPGSVPVSFALEQNYPNPFNPSTRIRYEVAEQSRVLLTIYNLLGERVSTVVDELRPAGRHVATWNAANMPSGVYFYTITAGSFTQTRKMVLMK